MIGESYKFRYDARPWTLNKERGMHWKAAGDLTAEWRHAFWALALENKKPRMKKVEIIVRQFCKDNRMPDPVACVGAYKAALDGLVDAGVIAKDTGEFVNSVYFEHPIVTGRDGLELELIEIGA